MSGSANNIEIVATNVLWQIEAQELIDFTGLTGLDVKGKYFTIYSAKDATSYYVWGDDGVAADPAPGGLTALPFTVVGDSDSATTLATACAAALEANADFTASSTGAVVDCKRAAVGTVSTTVDVDMGVAITICRTGQDFDLGLLEGDVVPTVTPALNNITSHQTGVTPIAALFQGYESIEMSTVLLETITSKLQVIYDLYGGSFTPSAGTEVFGMGLNKLGQNMLIYAARLVLKPVTAVDNSENMTLALTIPIPGAFTWSGENPRTLEVTWQGFVDGTIDSRVSAAIFGNQSQDLT